MNFRPWLSLPLVAVLVSASAPAQVADPVNVRKDALESLRAGLSFVDLSALAEPPRLTPDFIFAALDSGEVTLEVLVNLLLTPAADVTDPRRDVLRDAIDMLLESTRKVTAAGDSPEHRVLRGKLLLAAARLQDAYQVEVAGLQDAAAGALTDAASLPDWQLPAGMVLRRIGGGARINTLTGAYAANLSGELLLPGINAALSVPRASVDSRGNLDLTTHGAITLPPGDPRGILLSVPARTPLNFHVGEDGDFRASGGVRLTLPEAIKLDASFDIADPNYVFSLGYSGGVTLDLAREIHTIRPTVDFTAAQPLAMDALAGFAEFFGSFNAGMETLLREEPSLPDPSAIELGEPPVFETPETIVPFDVLDAWLTAIGNDFVRPSINGTLDASIEPARSIIRSMRNEVAAVRADLEPTAADIRSLARVVKATAAARRKLVRAVEVDELSTEQSGQLLNETALALQDAAQKTQAWLNNLPPGADIKSVLAVCKLLGDTSSRAAEAGVTTLPDLSTIPPRLTQTRTTLLASNGFAADASVADAAKVAALSHEDLLVMVFALQEIDAIAQNAGGSMDSIEETRVLVRRWFVKIRDLRQEAIERADMIQELEMSAWLAWSLLLHRDLLMLDLPPSPVTPTPDELNLMAFSLPDSHAAIVARNGGSALAKRGAGSLILAATKVQKSSLVRVRGRRSALFNEQITKSSAQDPAGLSLEEITFLNMVRDATQVMEGRGLLTTSALAGYKSALTNYLDYFRSEQARKFPGTTSVEDNLAAASRDLRELSEGLAFIHSFMPEKVELLGEFTQSWQALRVSWTVVVEAQKAHWYLTEYVRELDRMVTRYGINLEDAFGLALRASAMEAMAGLDRVTNAMNGLVATLGTEDVAFPLPGDLKINSAFGKLAFNRVTGDWALGFGGGIEFPESAFELDVFDAALSKNGAFSLNLGTRGEVPLGGDGSKMKFVVPQFEVNGDTTQQQLAFTTEGTLTYDPTPTSGDEFALDLGVSYDSQTGVVGLDAGLNNSPVRFGEDLVLLDGEVGLDFSVQNPQGALEVAGTFGVLARQKPLRAGALQANDFWLTFSVEPTRFNFTDDAMTAEIRGGSITLPADLFSSQAQPGDPPVSVAISSPLCLRYEFASGALTFCNPAGQPFVADLTNFKLALAELPGFQLAIASARLELNGSEFPVLRNLNAAVTVPLPGANANDASQNTSATFNVSAQNWRIDGLPEAASIGIAQNLLLADFNGFKLELLDGSAFSLAATPGFPRTLTLGLNGGIRAGFDERILRNNATGNAVFLTGNGALSWDMQSLPVLQNLDLALEGNFRFGADGPAITGLEDNTLARLEVENVGGLFNQLASPVNIWVEGAVDIPDAVKFGLVNTRFVLRGSGLEFDPGGVQTELRGQTLELAKDVLPVYLTKIRMEFKNPHPLVPATPGGDAFFDLTNLKFIISGGANIPNGALLDSGTPGLSGEVRDLEIGLRLDAQGNLLPEFNVDAIALQVENLTIPPLAELQGGIALVNLDQLSLDPPRPERVTFVGELKGSFNGVGAGALIASSATEFHGLAISASAGSAPVGIPLDGYALGGIMWSGATGGIHFKNSFDDPTEFSTYLQRDPEGNITGADEFPPPGDPGANPTNISDPFDELEAGDELYTKSDLPETPEGFDPFDMLQDNWPPRAANPLLEEFPAGSGRLVFKASRLTTAQADDFLDRIGLTEGATRDIEQIITAFVTEMTLDIRAQGDAAVTALIAASGVVGDQTLATHYQELSDKLVDSFDDAARPVLRQILQSALQAGTSLRPPLRDLLTSGIPGFNVTFLGSGTFTHTALAPVMDVKGTVSVSTTGAALSRGELRVSGIPVAEASVGFSLTKEDGNISPFLGGLARVGIGPLELGKLTMSASLPDAAAVVGHFDTFLQCSLSTLGAGAQAQFEIIAENAIGSQVPVGTALQDFLLARDDREKLAVAGALFDYFARAAEGTLPQQFALAQDDFNSLLNCFAVFVSSALNSFTPEIGFGGKIQPSLFDFPMTASGMPLASARMRFGPVLRTPNGSESLIDLLGNPDANLAPGTLPGVREFSAYAQFSPSALILSPISGTFVAFNASNAAFVGFTALDSAELGFSSQIEEWTPEKVLIFLTNPPQYFADRTEEFFNTAVLAAGYQMSPFGMKLADGQLRVVFPDSILHPRRPGGINAGRLGNPVRPFDSNGVRTLPLPSTDELILAALTAGKIKDATFRGGLDQLDDLFPPPPAEAATDGNLRKVHEVSASMRALDSDLSDLAGKSFAKDYFPYGGIIGGGQLALPQLLTRGLPPNWGDLFTKQGAEWLQSFDSVVTFLASTDSVGQLAYYVPAPNPVLFPGEDPAEVWSDMTIDDLLRRLQMDPAALVGRSIDPQLYEINEINMAGWAKADLLGIPLGEARLGYDGNSRRLLATAQLPPNTANDGNWFNDFLSGEAQFSIQLPSDQQSGLVTYGAAELFTHIQQNLGSIQSLSGAELDARIAQIQDSLKGALPRISAEIEAGVQLPAELQSVIRAQSGAGFFAFSPYFEPEYEPSNNSPYAVARRRGGLGIKGAFDFGFFPPTGDPIVISVPSASLALTPSANTAVLPAISGELQVGEFSIPGAPTFQDGLLQFASSPDDGAPYLTVRGSIEPFVFQLPTSGGPVDLLRAQPLPPATGLSASFQVLRSDGAPNNSALDLRLDPLSAAIPFLGSQVAISMHGGPNGAGGFLPFNFSTAEGSPWSAQVSLSAPGNPAAAPTFAIGNPFDPAGGSLMSFTPSGPVTGTVTGVGLESFSAGFTVSTGFEVVFYQGTPFESRVQTPAGRSMAFAFDSAGRVYCDLGDLTNISLPGLIQAGARIEFGFNPDDPQPDVRVTSGGSNITAPVSFGSINLVDSAVRTLVVRNDGTLPANIGFNINQGTSLPDFTLTHQGFQIEPGGQRELRIVFQPKAGGSRSATLQVTSNDPDSPLQNFTLSGTALQEPRYFASRPNIDFGSGLVGSTSLTTVTIGNSGSANMTVNTPSISGSGFTITPTGSTTLAPGTERVYTVSFTPGAQGTSTGSLTIPVNAPAVSTAIPLAGVGGETGWVQILDAKTAGSSANLNAIKMLDTKRGYIAGDAGTLLETRDGGRSWIPRELTKASLNGFAYYNDSDSLLTTPSLASYQFDEAPGTPSYLDGSGNLRHGLPAPGSAAPITTFSSGKFGSGLSLDGVDDYGELGLFSLPSSFTISLWCNPKNQGLDGQAIIANCDTAGSDRFVFGFYNGGYRIRFMFNTFDIPALRTSGWQHFLITGSYNSTANQTTVTLRRNGTVLGSNAFTGVLSASTGKRWLVGQQWNGVSGALVAADFFRGDIDAVQFFDGVVSAGRSVLEEFNGGALAVVGNSGRVYQTYGSSGLWAQHPDLNAAGWRNQTRTFQPFDWFSATYNSSGKLILGGHRVSGTSRVRALLYEDRNAGVDGSPNTADDEFADIAFSGAPAATNPRITGAAGYGNLLRVVGSDGVVYTENQSLTNTVTAGTPTAAAGLNAISYHEFFNSFVAAGNSGAIIQANNSSPVARTSGTTASLNAVAYDGAAIPSYHAVGSPGAWLTSDNLGQNWTVNSDKPAGNLRGVDVKHEPSGAPSAYHVWAVGEQHAAHLRPPQPPSGPFITFYPGKLDFGFVLLGETKTREITLTNRGRQNLTVTSVSISGPAVSRFVRTQSSLPSLRPGESGRIIVRYQPTGAASSFDSADLVIATNDAGQTFRVPLQGSCAGNNWQPSVLALSGVPVAGEVAQIEFTSATRGYALVNPPTGSSLLYHTADGGATWVRSTIGSFGGTLKLVAMDFARPTGSTSDVGMLAGHVENATGGFVKGLLLRTFVSNTSNAAPAWADHTPLGASQTLRIADVALTASFIGASTTTLRCVAATTGNPATANVWESTSSGTSWSTPTNRPSGFNGGPVATMAGSVFTPVLASSGSQVHMRVHNGGNWASPSQVVQLPENIRDMQFFFSNAVGADFNQGWTVGDNGSFLLWNPADSTGMDWFPAKNAEVFGTRNLTAVHSSNLYDVWVVGESQVFQSRDQGLTWGLNFDAGDEALMKTVSSDGVNAAWVGGSLSGKAAIWRYTAPPAPTLPVLTSVGMSDFGNVTPGVSPSTTITLTNNGNSTLPIHHLEIESSDSASRFRITGTTPASIAPGASANVSVAFSMTADPSPTAELKPAFMHRFEQEWDATVFLDDSSNARHADMVNFSGGITNPVSRRPRLAASFLRDRCLYFDGGDIIELNQGGGGPDQFGASGYAVSMWLAPDAVPTSSKVLLSKDSSTGGDLFKFSLEPTTHRLTLSGVPFNLAGTPKAGWQHLLLNCAQDNEGNSSFFLYRDGVLIGTGDSSTETLGVVSGKPWSIGAEWTSASTIGNGFQGSIDDVAIFERILNEGEIRQLATKSPLYGLHEAEMVVRSGSEGGERRINLRANVAPAAEFITLRTEPDGLPIQVDGVNYTSPVSFAVVHSASSQPGAREWVEGSRHRITALASHTSPNAAGSVKYDFHEWSGGGGREFFLTAQRVGATYTATYAPGVITAPGVAAPPARSTGSTILQGLAGSPKGPFLRITNGNLTLPNLGAHGFAISGDLYLGSERFQGRIASTALNLPATGTSRFLECGAANWSVDATAGGPFELTARPPSVRLIGYEAIPEGQVKLAFTPAAGAVPAKWLAEFQLLRDFKPVPDMIEFRKGRARVEWLAATDPPAFTLELNGGIRILKTPTGTFALSEAVNLRFDTVNFDLSLNQALASSGIVQPANLLQTGPFRIGWGDVRLRRSNGGPVFFAVTDFPFVFNNASVATVSGSLNTAGELALVGGLPAAGALLLDPSGNLRLKSPSGTSSFQMTVNSQPTPRLRLSTPSLRLETTGTNADLLPNGITIPGLEIDTAGAFDTGKLALPTLNFDGISISGPALGDRNENHLRLRRDALGEVTFNAKSQQDFLGDLQNLSMKLRVAGGSLSASGSIYGRFVLLPEPISLNYDSSQPCQFSSSAFGFTVYFGTGCAGVKARDPISGNQVTVIGNVP